MMLAIISCLLILPYVAQGAVLPLEQQLAEMKAQMGQLADDLQKFDAKSQTGFDKYTNKAVSVAFRVRNIPQGDAALSQWRQIFGDAHLNVGGHYNPLSGVFIAPVAGVYVFNIHPFQNHYLDLNGADVLLHGKRFVSLPGGTIIVFLPHLASISVFAHHADACLTCEFSGYLALAA